MGVMMGWKILVRITPNPIITPLQIRSHSQLFSDHTLTNKQLIIQCVFTYLAPSLCWEETWATPFPLDHALLISCEAVEFFTQPGELYPLLAA